MDKFLISKNEKSNRNEKDVKITTKLSIPRKRKYHEDYIIYGFIASEKDNSLPLCLICMKTLTNECMNPSKLMRHYNLHENYKNKPREYFETLRCNLKSEASTFKKIMKPSDQAQMISYKIAQLLARKKKPHSDGDQIILPALLITAETMLNNDIFEKFKSIPLSKQTISRRIQDISADIAAQLREYFNLRHDSIEKLWALQIDETTDISGKAQLLSFLRFVRHEKIVNEYFFCRELKQTSTGDDIFNLVNENVESFGLKWQDCVSVCTDGAPAMRGIKKGFIANVLKCNANVKVVHCMIHREILVSKSVPAELLQTLSEVVKVVNYIKSNALRSRIFSALCEAMDSDYRCLLFHTETRWLSKGKVLNRFVHMKDEILFFIETSADVTFTFLKNEYWWLQVSFLSDLFDKLNNVNLCLQGAQENFITMSGKLKSFVEKLKLWTCKIKNLSFESFPTVDSNTLKLEIKSQIEKTLESLIASFLKYFPDLDVSNFEWVVNPFISTDTTYINVNEEEILIDIRNDLVLKGIFKEKELSEFWLTLRQQYPQIVSKAIEALLPFGSSYLCEHGFSALTEMKSKKRERLQIVDEEMRVCLSKTEPRFSLMCSQKQSHHSH